MTTSNYDASEIALRKQIPLHPSVARAMTAHGKMVASNWLDTQVQKLAGTDAELARLLRDQLVEVNGKIVSAADHTVDSAELCRRTRQALGRSPAAAPAAPSDAAASKRALLTDNLHRLENLRADIAEGKTRGPYLDTRILDQQIEDLKRELDPPKRHQVMTPAERERAKLELAASTATGQTRAALESKLGTKPSRAFANPWLKKNWNPAMQEALSAIDSSLAAKFRADAEGL